MSPNVQWLGYAAGALIVSSAAPQTIKALRSGSAGDLSWLALTTFEGGSFMWLAYGLLTRAIPIWGWNVVAVLNWAVLGWAKLSVTRRASAHASTVDVYVLSVPVGTQVYESMLSIRPTGGELTLRRLTRVESARLAAA